VLNLLDHQILLEQEQWVSPVLPRHNHQRHRVITRPGPGHNPPLPVGSTDEVDAPVKVDDCKYHRKALAFGIIAGQQLHGKVRSQQFYMVLVVDPRSVYGQAQSDQEEQKASFGLFRQSSRACRKVLL
jgi:hypothetical protein